MARFTDKNILITGGSSGIGFATAARLRSEGARVLVTGTNPEKLRRVQDDLPGVLTLLNDAGDPEAARTLARHAREVLGPEIHGVFLNAGFGLFLPHDQVGAEDFDRQYAVNVRGPVLHVQALSPLLEDGAAIVLNTSVAQDLGMPGGILYGSTKGALRTVTRVLAAELAGRNIRVNAVSPGPIGSDFFARTGMPAEQIEQMAAGILAQVPLGRFGEPREVAAVAAFLLSEDASFVTGAEYIVDGGMTQV